MNKILKVLGVFVFVLSLQGSVGACSVAVENFMKTVSEDIAEIRGMDIRIAQSRYLEDSDIGTIAVSKWQDFRPLSNSEKWVKEVIKSVQKDGKNYFVLNKKMIGEGTHIANASIFRKLLQDCCNNVAMGSVIKELARAHNDVANQDPENVGSNHFYADLLCNIVLANTEKFGL